MQHDKLDLVILKIILNDRKHALDFVNECSEKLFSPDLWKFAKIVVDHIKTYRDIPTKRILLDRIQISKNDALQEYVSSIFSKLEEVKYDSKEYRYDLERLKNRFSEKIIFGLKEGLNSSNDLKKNINDIQLVLNSVKQINQPKIFKEGSLKDYADDFKNSYSAKLQDPSFGAGIKTGYGFIDYAMGGFKKSEMVLFAGITSSGKSLLLMNTAIQMWMGDNNIAMNKDFKQGYNVLLFSLEMNYEDYMQRALARLAMVPQKSIRDAVLTDDDKFNITRAFKFIKSYTHTFKVVDLPRRATSEFIERIIDEETEKNFKPDIVVIDYLNLMDADGGKDGSDWLIQNNISSELHELARTKEVVMLSAVQLNPKSMGEGKGEVSEASIKGLRRATSIADHADAIIGINTRKGEKNYPDFSCSFLKNRRGELIDGKLRKEMACCALLNQKFDDNQNIEDISAIIGG